MKIAPELTKKKEKNVIKDAIQGKIGKIYIPDQKVCRKEAEIAFGVIPGLHSSHKS
ncbi:ribosome production factor 2 homolog [Olea europaea subsp. europaea]|uniref:Ribosome production factor 2 homolog n=1 Tax=Olea europaea subsp. europaea TaxID=158383 RepID=A0A8S0UB35_OLEEU|nr:ribosome production factor 2 homolog [Olea europaea subsp. europaea]